MPLNPSKPVYERVEFIQVNDVGDLPALNAGGSPKLGTMCRVNSGDFYQVVVDDTAITGTLIWEQIGGGGASLPDQRFTVAPATYNLDTPGTNTFTSPQAGVGAASLGTGTTLPALSVTSQRVVWIMPARYDGAEAVIALFPYIHINGAAGAAQAPELANYNFSLGSNGGYIVISNLRLTDCTFDISPGGSTTLVFQNCVFDNCTLVVNANADANIEVCLRFLNCSGDFENVTFSGNGFHHVEFSGSSTGEAVYDSSIGTVGSAMTFTNPISVVGGCTVDMVVKSGQRLVYGGLYLVIVEDGSGFFLNTSSCWVEMSNASVSLIRLLDNGSAADWTSGAGTSVIGVPESIFDADPNTQGICTIFEMAFPINNPAITTELANPRSGGTTQFIGGGDGRCMRIISYNINVAAGGTIASQTATITEGTADVVWVTATYEPGYVLQPDTASAQRAFGSLLLLDPEFMPEGKEITIYNAGDPAVLQSAFALRLPNGTPSRIGNQQPDVTANPVYTNAEYIILYPGDSVKLIVNQSFFSPRSYIVSSLRKAVVEPGWLAEAMAQYDVLPAPIAGNNTTGMIFFARQSTSSGAAQVYCQGGRFYWGNAVPRTIRVSLWRTGSAVAVATVDVAVAGVGIYEGRFTTPAAINGYENWFITFYETTGAVYQEGLPIPNFALRIGPNIPMRNYDLYTGIQSASQAGNAKPAIIPGSTIYYLIEPIVAVNEV